ncbi:hypothetical protein LCGC14_1397470 [marine sediment metagenome]|uniref:Uncharacterized protein n=1 Tax=marine sediment metagenome TaxID=412755 RepID=A0A0F9JY45_9ZZZZ
MNFENLAGRSDCDVFMRTELKESGITIIEEVIIKNSEVPYSLVGALGGDGSYAKDQIQLKNFKLNTVDSLKKYYFSFIFTRCWYYWSVSGYVPLEVASKLYNDSIGSKYVRVAGHCGCPRPEEWVLPYKICGKRVIDSYHIDTQSGLNLFACEIKRMLDKG